MGFEKLKEKWQVEEEMRRREAEQRRDTLLTRCRPLFERYKIREVILFGSVAEGKSTASSDIDLLVSPLKNVDYWTFKRDIEEVTGYPVDLYTQDDEALFVSKLRSRGEVIFSSRQV